jgi:hypothetical protein
MKTLLIIALVLFVIGLVLVVGWNLLADAIRGLGHEPEPSGKPEPRTPNAQQRMAERKLDAELKRLKDFK